MRIPRRAASRTIPIALRPTPRGLDVPPRRGRSLDTRLPPSRSPHLPGPTGSPGQGTHSVIQKTRLSRSMSCRPRASPPTTILPDEGEPSHGPLDRSPGGWQARRAPRPAVARGGRNAVGAFPPRRDASASEGCRRPSAGYPLWTSLTRGWRERRRTAGHATGGPVGVLLPPGSGSPGISGSAQGAAPPAPPAPGPGRRACPGCSARAS